MEVLILKKIILFLLLTIMTLTNASVISAESYDFYVPVCISVNGNYIKTDTKPYLEDGTTYVPVRAIADSLDSDSVTWNADTKNVLIKKDDITISIIIGKKTAFVNNKEVTVPGGAFIKNDRTYVPLRFVSESFGAKVGFNPDTYTVTILKDGVSVPSHCILERAYSDEDIYWLSRIINAESGGEPFIGKVAVGNVVINRVKSKDYPNTITDVIFDTKYGVQFEPIINGSIYAIPSGESIIAAKNALEGKNVVANSLFFLNESIAENFWIVENRTYLTKIGQHTFYL